jgi:hypothetical protein
MYFATLNFQQVSHVEKSGCMMWVFSGKKYFFLIKTVLNQGICAISCRKPRVKPGTVMIEIVPSGEPLYLVQNNSLFFSSKVLRIFNYSWNLFLGGECYNLGQDNMGGNCCDWNCRFRLDY